MVETVCRMYDSRSRAETAMAALGEQGLDQAQLLGATVADEPGRDAYLATLRDAGVPTEAAAFYADRLVQGASMIVARPYFGMAARATAVLDAHHPLALAVPEPPAAQPACDPTPLSSWLGLPTLSRTQLPFESLTGLDSLKPGTRYFTERWWGRGLLISNPTPLSSAFSWRVLTDKATPLSSWLGWRLLSSNPTPFSSALGWRLQSAGATPFSTWLGWRLLSDNRTPLSTRFGWRLLINEPEPFAVWIGWKQPAQPRD